MPSEGRYSLFPPSDDALLSQNPKKPPTARPKTPTGHGVKRQPSMHTIREEDRKDELPSHAPVQDKSAVLQPPTIRVQVPAATEPSDHQPSSAISVKSPSISPAAAQAQSPIYPPPERPLPRAPGASSAPKARAPALKTASPSSSQPFVTLDHGRGHARNCTNDSASSAMTALKYSPVSPDSLISPGSMFSPITPASDTASVSYPLIPKMSSSPAPSVTNVAWSPLRRSNTRTSNSTSRTYNTHQTSHSRTNGSDVGVAVAPPSLHRSPSIATSRPSQADHHSGSERSGPAFQSIFPTWNPEVPLAQQEYKPNFSWTLPAASQRPSMSSRPSIDAASIGSQLTEDNLRALNQSPNSSTPFPPRSASVPTVAARDAPPPRLPHTDAQAPKPKSANADDTSLPTFAPPPNNTTTIISKSSRPLKVSRPRTKMVLAKRPKANAIAKLKSVNGHSTSPSLSSTTWKSTTTAVTQVDEKVGCVTTTATTTLALGNDKDGASLSQDRDALGAGVSRWAPLHASDVPDVRVDAPEGVQHGMTVALGAVAFVMGVGVEVMGGAVGGMRRKKHVKDRGEKA